MPKLHDILNFVFTKTPLELGRIITMDETNEQAFDRHFQKLTSGSCDSHLSTQLCVDALRKMQATPLYGLGEMSSQLNARASALAEASGRSYESVMTDIVRPVMSNATMSPPSMFQVTM